MKIKVRGIGVFYSEIEVDVDVVGVVLIKE